MAAATGHAAGVGAALPAWGYGLLVAIVVTLLSTVVLVLVVLDGRTAARDQSADTGLGLIDAAARTRRGSA